MTYPEEPDNASGSNTGELLFAYIETLKHTEGPLPVGSRVEAPDDPFALIALMPLAEQVRALHDQATASANSAACVGNAGYQTARERLTAAIATDAERSQAEARAIRRPLFAAPWARREKRLLVLCAILALLLAIALAGIAHREPPPLACPAGHGPLPPRSGRQLLAPGRPLTHAPRVVVPSAIPPNC